MCGKGDHVRITNRRGIDTPGNQPRRMGYIRHEPCPAEVCYFPERCPVRRPGVGGVSGNDHGGAVFLGQCLHKVVVEPAGPGMYTVGYNPVGLARKVKLAAVAQMPSMGQFHGKQCISGLQEGMVDRDVRSRTGNGLHVHMDLIRGFPLVCKTICAASLCQGLCKVDVFGSLVESSIRVSPVIGQVTGMICEPVFIFLNHSLRRISFCIEAYKNASHCLSNRTGCDGF